MADDQPVDGGEAERAEKERWEAFVKWHEDNGYTVEGDSFANCYVPDLPAGPTHVSEPGS